MTSVSTLVQRRLVIYFSGFDPAGPGRYHKLYVQQASLAAPLLQANIKVSELQHQEVMHLAQWQVSYQPVQQNDQADLEPLGSINATETDYIFARWDDIARQHWPQLSSAKEIFQFIRDFFATHWLFIHSGTMHKITKLDKAPASMLLMPLFLALGAIFLGLVSFVLLLASWAVPYFPTINPAPQFPVTQVATYSIAFTVAWIIGMILLERHWHMLWVMRSYIFTGLHARGLAPEIEGRLNHIAEQIRQQIARHAYDEILLVGHSTGSIMATLTLSRLFEKIPNHPTIGLLTLGQWWPWLGYLPSAQFAQDRLRHVASQTELTWIDVSAAADGCCFSFIDPLVTLADPPSPCIHPKLVSARWHTLFSKQDYRQLRKNPFRVHMQYLYASPKLGVCDFFAITAGSLRLAERFANVPAFTPQK
jgi:hypothetical protein